MSDFKSSMSSQTNTWVHVGSHTYSRTHHTQSVAGVSAGTHAHVHTHALANTAGT